MLFTDQINHTIEIPNTPKRIISAVPSQTELLYDLGLEKEVIGITKFCVHPEKWFKNKTRIGGTKNLKIEKIKALNPDLIIANKEENTEAEIKALQQLFPVWTSDISTLQDSLNMIKTIGEITEKNENASRIINTIEQEFKKYQSNFTKRHTALYLIWKNPYMSIGNDTIIHHLMAYCGFDNVLKDKTRYPEISEAEIKQLQPEFILLSSEPYPFKEKHIAELKNLCPTSKIMLVDGEIFSWYGSRLQYTPKYFFNLWNGIKIANQKNL